MGAPPPGDPDGNKCVMKRLGYLSFDSNECSNHQARELKSVHVNVPCFMIRLVVDRNNVNKLNIYSQVSSGRPLTSKSVPQFLSFVHYNAAYF